MKKLREIWSDLSWPIQKKKIQWKWWEEREAALIQVPIIMCFSSKSSPNSPLHLSSLYLFLFFSLWYFCLCYQLKGTAAQIFIFYTWFLVLQIQISNQIIFLFSPIMEIYIPRERDHCTLNKSIWDCNEYKHTYIDLRKYKIK